MLKKGNRVHSVVLKDEMADMVEKVSSDFGISKARFISNCVEICLADIRLFSRVGLTPRRITAAKRLLVRKGFMVEPEDRESVYG